MNEKEKQISKDSVDVIISSIPGLNIAWNLSKSLYGAGLKLRKQKAFEWVEMIKDHPEIFTIEILQLDEFQDGFVYLLEKYIRERSKGKRNILKSIFLDFTVIKNKESYPLEKMTHTTTQLSEEDVAVLRDVKTENIDTKNYQIYGNIDKNIENIYNLINLGLLLETTGNRLGPINAPYVCISKFGKKFTKYLIN